MLSLYRQAITNQYIAALLTLKKWVRQCPEHLWNAPVVNLKYSQVVFHSLFFTDVYLGPNLAALREQTFHRDNPDFFADYEELEDRPPVRVYGKPQLDLYIRHCDVKAREVLAQETEDELAAEPGFDWLPFSRAEVHVTNVRHLQHHAAQLSLHLNQRPELAWVGCGPAVNDHLKRPRRTATHAGCVRSSHEVFRFTRA